MRRLALLVVTSLLTSPPPIQVAVLPRVALGPRLTVRVRATVERDPRNSLLALELDAPDFYSRKDVVVDGVAGPRIVVWFADVASCGPLTVAATVARRGLAPLRAETTVELACGGR